jgi:hypothetical protein
MVRLLKAGLSGPATKHVNGLKAQLARQPCAEKRKGNVRPKKEESCKLMYVSGLRLVFPKKR